MAVRRRLRRGGAILAGLAVVVLIGSTSGIAPAAATPAAPPRTWTVQVGSESPDQAIQGMSFLPANIWVHPGDTVDWQANAAEIHSVTFLADQSATTPPDFNPFDPSMVLPAGGPTYQAGQYFNSGLLTTEPDGLLPSGTDYRLTFPATGDFVYFCLVHGAMMRGVVHVLPASQPYPYTPKDYADQNRATERSILLDGLHLATDTRQATTGNTVAMGADDGMAMVMRFIKQTIVVHVGESVTWRNGGMAAPHTVTFGTEPANIFAPSGDPTDFAGGDLSSGIVPPHGSYTVTFTKAGVYPYICALHDYMGMTGKVIVQG